MLSGLSFSPSSTSSADSRHTLSERSSMQHDEHHGSGGNVVQLPRSTAWPLILSFGISLMILSLRTTFLFFILGLLLSIAGAVGWFRQVLPEEAHEAIPVTEEE